MAIVRYLVTDVDASIAFYAVLGLELADRWGAIPFRTDQGAGRSPGALRGPLRKSNRVIRAGQVDSRQSRESRSAPSIEES